MRYVKNFLIYLFVVVFSAFIGINIAEIILSKRNKEDLDSQAPDDDEYDEYEDDEFDDEDSIFEDE